METVGYRSLKPGTPLLPILRVAFHSELRESWTGDEDALLDSGSGSTVFPTRIAEELGLKIGPPTIPAATGGGTAFYRRCEEELIHCFVLDHHVLVAAHFSDDAELPMLGLNDFFRHFLVTFDSLEKAVQLDAREPGCCTK